MEREVAIDRGVEVFEVTEVGGVGEGVAEVISTQTQGMVS